MLALHFSHSLENIAVTSDALLKDHIDIFLTYQVELQYKLNTTHFTMILQSTLHYYIKN